MRNWVIKLPLKKFRLLAVGKPFMEPSESGLGRDVLPKPPGLRTVRMFGDDLVSAGTLVLTEFVLDNGCWNRERNVDDDLRKVVVWIGENMITVGTIAFVNVESFLWLWRCSGRSFVAFITSGRRVTGGV
jgi:hypothetical protein